MKELLLEIKTFLLETKEFLTKIVQKFFNFNQKSWTQSLLFLTLTFFFIASFFIILIPSLREPLRETYLKKKPYRKILSSLSSRLFPDRRYFKILKVKTHEGLFIEIYKHSLHSKPPLLFDRIRLPHPYNGYFHIRKQAVALAVYDINKDKNMEILAPSFNKHLSGYLNIYTYDEEKSRFVEFSPEI